MTAMPMVFNNTGISPVQFNMRGSVGYGGKNFTDDVTAIQALLNCLPTYLPGSSAPLVVDGQAGARTVQAICKFQKSAVLRVVDGRIDPCGATIRALGTTLIKHNAFPLRMPSFVEPSNEILQMIGAIPSSPVVPYAGTRGNSNAIGDSPKTPPSIGASTGWKIYQTSKIILGAGSVPTVAGIVLSLYLKHKTLGHKRVIDFKGFGVGISVNPVTVHVSLPTFQSQSTDMCYGLSALLAAPSPVPLDEFSSFYSSYLTLDGSIPLLGGIGMGLLNIGSLSVTGKYQCFLVGMQKGTANAAHVGYVGMTSISSFVPELG